MIDGKEKTSSLLIADSSWLIGDHSEVNKRRQTTFVNLEP